MRFQPTPRAARVDRLHRQRVRRRLVGAVQRQAEARRAVRGDGESGAARHGAADRRRRRAPTAPARAARAIRRKRDAGASSHLRRTIGPGGKGREGKTWEIGRSARTPARERRTARRGRRAVRWRSRGSGAAGSCCGRRGCLGAGDRGERDRAGVGAGVRVTGDRDGEGRGDVDLAEAGVERRVEELRRGAVDRQRVGDAGAAWRRCRSCPPCRPARRP